MRSTQAAPVDAEAIRYAGREVSDVDFLTVLGDRAGERPSFYWEHAERGDAVLAFGEVARVVSFGPDRVTQAGREITRIARCLEAGSAHDPTCPGPVFVGGFSFSAHHSPEGVWSELPPCLFLLPAETWIRRGGRTWRIEISSNVALAAPAHDGFDAPSAPAASNGDGFDCDVEHGSGSDDGLDVGAAFEQVAQLERQRWCARVERALAQIESGTLKKVVLARKAERPLAAGFDAVGVVRSLRSRRPQCFTFRLAAGETLFFGSTPELLVRVTGLGVETQALAGTTARGEDAKADAALALALRESVKNRHEQSLVTRDLVAALSHLATDIYAASEPRVLSVPEAHHLTTPVMAHLREPIGALAVANRLHPTPAACGTPREEARALLDDEERDRGWYAGAVGWVDPSGDGELAVALRSAVACRDRLVAWAGAGIVEGSQPADELEETEIKLRAVLGALGD